MCHGSALVDLLMLFKCDVPGSALVDLLMLFKCDVPGLSLGRFVDAI